MLAPATSQEAVAVTNETRTRATRNLQVLTPKSKDKRKLVTAKVEAYNNQRVKINWPHIVASSWLFSSSKSIWRWNKNKLIVSLIATIQLSSLARRMVLSAATLPTLIKESSVTTMKIESVLFLISLDQGSNRLMSGHVAHSLQSMMVMVDQLAQTFYVISSISLLYVMKTSHETQS